MVRESSPDTPPSRGWYAVLIGAAIVSSALIAFFVRGGMTDLQRLHEQKQHLKQQNELLRERARDLQLRRRRLHQDPQVIEELARDRLGLTRPGERQVEFEETGPDTAADTTLTDTPRTSSDDS